MDVTVVTATSSSIRGRDTTTDTTTVGPVPGVTLEPDRKGTAPPGTVKTYTHTLTNKGNDTDTSEFSFESSQRWTVLSFRAVTARPWRIDQRKGQYPRARRLAPGIVDTTRVTALSRTDRNIFDTATDTTTVGQASAVDLVPDGEKDARPGTLVTYNHS